MQFLGNLFLDAKNIYLLLVIKIRVGKLTEKDLSKIEQIALKEYEFADKLRENYFTSSWVATSIILPISFGLIGASYVDELLGLCWWQLVPLMLASIFLYLFWIGYIIRYAGYMKSIYKRSKELEQVLNMRLHSSIEQGDNKKGYRRMKSLRCLNIVMLILLIVAWLWRLSLAPMSL